VVPDLIVAGGDVVTMNPGREVLVSGAVAIGGSKIVQLGSVDAFRRRWPGTPELDARGCVVTPGMVNTHQHVTGDPLVRSCIPDDLAPGRAVTDWIVPVHAVHLAGDDELAATLTAVESVRNGVTMLVEAGTVAEPVRAAAGLDAVGVRATIGTWGWDVGGGPFAGPADEVLDRQRQVLDAFPPGGSVTGWVTLVGHGLASDELLAGAAALARSRGTGLTLHMSPTSADGETFRARAGCDPLVHLDHLGVLGPHLLVAHGVWLSDAEVDAVLRTRTALAYCPWAYLRLGQGVTRRGRHAEIFQRGGRVGLGCDAVNAGDQLDILRVAALAAGLAKDMRSDPTWFGAHEAFEMATIRGAEAIGMAERIGSIEVGKEADLVVHDATAPQWTPRGDVALQLVWSADGRTVRDVVIGGRIVVRDRVCLTVDEATLRAEAADAAQALRERASLPVAPRWPHVPADAHDAPPVGRLPGVGRLT
jgi:5-methylthioadenosine/S-adenosylhomocysteine deaminase